MPFEIVRNDITKMHTDAIVNAANTGLQMGSGVCGAIFNAAGSEELQKACNAIGGCETGSAVITKGGRLPANYVIHTVGPVWQGGAHGEEALLRACYRNSLQLASQYNLQSIAFPLISSGIYGYPKEEALRVATEEIRAFLLHSEMSVSLVVFDKQAFSISAGRYASVQSYIDENYVAEHAKLRRAQYTPLKELVAPERQKVAEEESACFEDALEILAPSEMAAPQKQKRNLEDLMMRLGESFSQMLLRLIDEKNMDDVETYKRANIDRKLFSKIRSNSEYKPSKPTAIAFAIALQLTLDETKDLLAKAGYALSRSSKFDVIVEYYIEEENWDIYEINEALFTFDQALLGGVGR